MKFNLLMSLIFVFVLTGCDKKIDATNKESFLESIKSIEADLPDDKYIAFTVGIDRLTIKSVLPLSNLVNDQDISDEELHRLSFDEIRKTFDGKTADEIIKASEEYKKAMGW